MLILAHQSMLEVSNLHAGYGKVRVLFGLNFNVKGGEVHCLLGRNGAGKSTALKAIMGLVKTTTGSIKFEDSELTHLPAHDIPKQRIGLIPQGRRLFSELTVAENLRVGLMTSDTPERQEIRVFELFPRLQERLQQKAGTLSGGEQQMLAVARALCLEPKLLLLDEPTEGLQPTMVALITDAISQLKNDGVAILLVEQHVDTVISVADRVTFVDNGRTVASLKANEFEDNRDIFSTYLGV